jgi:pimeloyl-ACP methyl ester carboxylesterase
MFHKRLIFFGVLAFVSSGGAAQEMSARLAAVIPQPYEAASYPCTFDRVMAGPGGVEFTVWLQDAVSVLGNRTSGLAPGMVVLGRMHDASQRRSDRLVSYSGGGTRLYPIRWSPTGDRLFVRVREQNQHIVTMTADSAPLGDAGPLDNSWRLIDINAVSHGGVDVLTAPTTRQSIARINGRELIRGSATLDQGVQLLGVQRSDLQLVRVDGASVVPLGLSSSPTHRLAAFGSADVYPAGVAYLGAARIGERGFIPYQLPVVDLMSGMAVGRFGLTSVALDRPSRLRRALSSFLAMREAEGLMVLDASLSGDTMFVLTLSGRGERKLFRLSAGGVSARSLCTRPTETPSGSNAPAQPFFTRGDGAALRVRAFAIDASGREVAQAGRPILMVYRMGTRPGRGATIYFHGGPGAAMAETPLPLPVRRLVSPNHDVITIEYSGSLGGGEALVRRLADGGVAAIEEDVDALRNWLDRQNYGQISVIGSSFGAVPALAAVARHRNRIAHAFFVAPALRLLDPASWAATGTSPWGAVNPATQMAREDAYFRGASGRVRFASDLQALLTRTPLTSSDSFYFGDVDPVSRPEHLPEASQARRHVYPRTSHVAIMARSDLWQDIEAVLGNRAGPAAAPIPQVPR